MSNFWNQDAREYFDSQQVNALKTSRDASARMESRSCNTQEAYASMRNAISEIKENGLSDPIVSSDVAIKVLAHVDVIIITPFPVDMSRYMLLMQVCCSNLCVGF